jgi:hypothetical protein
MTVNSHRTYRFFVKVLIAEMSRTTIAISISVHKSQARLFAPRSIDIAALTCPVRSANCASVGSGQRMLSSYEALESYYWLLLVRNQY